MNASLTLGITTHSETETAQIASSLAGGLSPGDVVLLKGELGAGKTFFVKAAARALGVTEPVTSPSFAMGQSYVGDVTVHHLDLYRLPSFGTQEMADFEPFFESDAITFVEWPQTAEPFLGQPKATVTMEHVDEQSRRLLIESSDRGLVERISRRCGPQRD